MNAIERIQKILSEEGYAVNLTELDGGMNGPLLVTLRPDPQEREMILLIEIQPMMNDDDSGLICFNLVYPYFIPSPDPLPELLRMLFILNRLLPVGQHGFCEQTPAVFFNHNLLVKDPVCVEPDVIKDAVGMIGYFTHSHGYWIDQALSEKLDCDTLLDELDRVGQKPQPLFSQALAGS